MKIKEIKEKVEKVIRVEYIAEDGTIFYDQAECEKYEKSALFVISKKLERLASTSETDLFFGGCEDNTVEIFNIETDEDLANLKKYVYLTTIDKGNGENPARANIDELEKITSGHEVIITWSYDFYYLWTYGNGSLQSYFDETKANYDKILSKNEEQK